MSIPKKLKTSKSEPNFSTFTHSFKESKKLLSIEYELCAKLESLKFKSPIEYIYKPLHYAKHLHEEFIKKYFEKSTKKIMFLALNPGPWGMCQTGIAFGEINYVKDWFKINGAIEKPEKEHPKKRVTGLECHRIERSGKKFWGLFKDLCGTPEKFFRHAFVFNLCPLAFLDASGKNITPPEIKDNSIKKQLNSICVEALLKIIHEFNFEIIICIGKYAEKEIMKTLKNVNNIRVCSIPHPSPRNSKNFLNWEKTVLKNLQDYNLLKYFNEEEEIESKYFT